MLIDRAASRWLRIAVSPLKLLARTVWSGAKSCLSQILIRVSMPRNTELMLKFSFSFDKISCHVQSRRWSTFYAFVIMIRDV